MSEPAEYARNSDGAYAMGLDGATAPSWVKGDVTHFRAYKRGLDERGGPAAAPHLPTRAPSRAARARSAGNRIQSSSPAQYAGRAFSPRAAYQRAAAPHVERISRAGDGGGLFLALVLYPAFVAVAKYGPSGLGLWFRAKWLNNGAGPNALPTPATAPATPNLPDAQQATPPTRPRSGVGVM